MSSVWTAGQGCGGCCWVSGLLCSDKSLSRWEKEARNYRPAAHCHTAVQACTQTCRTLQHVCGLANVAHISLCTCMHRNRHTQHACSVDSISTEAVWSDAGMSGWTVGRSCEPVVAGWRMVLCVSSGFWGQLSNSHETGFWVGSGLISAMQGCSDVPRRALSFSLLLSLSFTHTHTHTHTLSSPSFFSFTRFSKQLVTFLSQQSISICFLFVFIGVSCWSTRDVFCCCSVLWICIFVNKVRLLSGQSLHP